MNIGMFPPKEQLYHFVLFYNIPPEKLAFYAGELGGKEDDNALLTYCYLDSQCGMSYRALCCVTVDDENENLRFGDPGSAESLVIIREGGLNSEALVIDEDELKDWSEEAESIKKIYGYRKDLVVIDEGDPFSKSRHPQFPQDIFTLFIGPDHNKEMIWVREQKKMSDGSILALMIDEPFDPSFGIHKGDTVLVMISGEDQKSYMPFAVLPRMKDQA